jgi:hypothetical protein
MTAVGALVRLITILIVAAVLRVETLPHFK